MKLKKMGVSLTAFTFLITATAAPAMACSRILWNENGEANVVARTMDLYMSDQAELVVSPKGQEHNGLVEEGANLEWVSKYGSVGVTAYGISTTDGLNEAGLSANLLYLTGSEYGERDEEAPGLSNLRLAQYVLDNFASVSEAVDGLESVQVVATEAEGRTWPLHLSIADETGNSAVIEFIEGEMVVHQGKDVTVMTNEPTYEEQISNLKNYKPFGGSQSLPGDIDPMSRFVRAATYVQTLPKPEDATQAVAGAYSVAKNVAVPFGAQDSSASDAEDTWSTLWFTLADITNLTYYFQSTRSPNLYWVDLANVDLSKGAPVLKVDAYDYSLTGEVSDRLEPVGDN